MSTATASHDPRVCVDLRDLVNLRHRTRGFSFGTRQPISSLLSGRHASRLRGRGLSFEELRQYRMGDDIRTMDWKVTNRLRKPYVRVYNEEKERRVFFVVDQSASMFFGSREKMKSVVAAELCALGAWRVLQGGDKVGALVFSHRDCVQLAPQRSEHQVLRLLGELQRYNHQLPETFRLDLPGRFGLDTALRQLQARKPQNALVVVISDFMQRNKAYLARLGQLRVGNDVIAAQVVDALEQHLPDTARFVASDGELQLHVDGKEDTFKQRYADAVSADQGQVQDHLKRHGIPLLAFNTFDPVDGQLRALIGSQVAARGGAA